MLYLKNGLCGSHRKPKCYGYPTLRPRRSR